MSNSQENEYTEAVYDLLEHCHFVGLSNFANMRYEIYKLSWSQKLCPNYLPPIRKIVSTVLQKSEEIHHETYKEHPYGYFQNIHIFCG